MTRAIALFFGLGFFLFVTGLVSGEEWATPIRGLTGRLRAEVKGDQVKLWLDLKNDGNLPYWVTTHSPFAFDLAVKAADGVELKPDAERSDITSSPQAAIVPCECVLSMPVTLSQKERWNLDIVTKLWSLKPGKYRLTGTYSTAGVEKEPKLQGKAYLWHGEIQLPEIELDIP